MGFVTFRAPLMPQASWLKVALQRATWYPVWFPIGRAAGAGVLRHEYVHSQLTSPGLITAGVPGQDDPEFPCPADRREDDDPLG